MGPGGGHSDGGSRRAKALRQEPGRGQGRGKGQVAAGAWGGGIGEPGQAAGFYSEHPPSIQSVFVQAATAQRGEWPVAPVKTEQDSGTLGRRALVPFSGWPPASSRPLPEGAETDGPLPQAMSCPSRSPRCGHSQGGPCVSGFPGYKRRLRDSLSLAGGHTAGERCGELSPSLLG